MHLKKQMVKLRSKGVPNEEVAGLLELHPSTTSKWWNAHKRGEDIFTPKKEGRPKGSNKRLKPFVFKGI